MAAYLTQHHYTLWWSYQPASRWWQFQLTEGGWLLTAFPAPGKVPGKAIPF